MDHTGQGERKEPWSAGELQTYAALFQRLPVACVETSSRGSIRRANHEAAALFNVSRSSCVGKNLIGFVVRGDCKAFRALSKSVLSATIVEQAQIRFRPRHGRPIVRANLAVRRIDDGLLWTLHLCAAEENADSRGGSTGDRPAIPNSEVPSHLPRVLCVEDDVDSREMMADLLASEGFTVRTAGTLLEAADAIASASSDVILINYLLPDGDGATFIESLAAQGRLGGARVAMITGHPRARQLSGVPCWTKPINPRTLGAQVRALLT